MNHLLISPRARPGPRHPGKPRVIGSASQTVQEQEQEEEAGGAPGAAPLLLLHGTGGDESDLLPLGATLSPGAALLSPRGRVLEHGMPRFFRRLAEGVFDEDDVRRRAAELGDFVTEARQRYGIEAPPREVSERLLYKIRPTRVNYAP